MEDIWLGMSLTLEGVCSFCNQYTMFYFNFILKNNILCLPDSLSLHIFRTFLIYLRCWGCGINGDKNIGIYFSSFILFHKFSLFQDILVWKFPDILVVVRLSTVLFIKGQKEFFQLQVWKYSNCNWLKSLQKG